MTIVSSRERVRAESLASPRLEQVRIPFGPAFGAAVARFLKQSDFDVAECSTWDAALLSYAAISARATAVVARADLPGSIIGTMQRGRLERRLVTCADATVAVSDYVGRALEDRYAWAVDAVIPNGVDTHTFRHTSTRSLTEVASGEVVTYTGAQVTGLLTMDRTAALSSFERRSAGRPVALWIGKPTVMKGWDIFCELTYQCRTFCAFVALIAGVPTKYAHPSVPDAGSILLRELGTEDLPRLYSRADVVVSTSRWEGFQLTNLEALACGTPLLMPRWLEATHHYAPLAGNDATYETLVDLRDRLAARRWANPTRVPPALSWRSNAAKSLDLYRLAMARLRLRQGSARRFNAVPRKSAPQC